MTNGDFRGLESCGSLARFPVGSLFTRSALNTLAIQVKVTANAKPPPTCVVLSTVWITVSIIVIFSGEPEASVFIQIRAGFVGLQLQMDGVVEGRVLQDILIKREMLLLPPVLNLDMQERVTLMGNSIDLL